MKHIKIYFWLNRSGILSFLGDARRHIVNKKNKEGCNEGPPPPPPKA